MAVGDKVFFGPTSVAAAGFLDLQPGAGIEASIHNICHQADVELYIYDGVNSILADSDPDGGYWGNLWLNVSNTKYYRVKNTNAAAKWISGDGVQTK